MRLTKAVEWWLSELKLSKAKGTVAVYESDLRQLAARARPDHIAAFDAELCGGFLAEAQAAGMKRSTLHRKQSAPSPFLFCNAGKPKEPRLSIAWAAVFRYRSRGKRQ